VIPCVIGAHMVDVRIKAPTDLVRQIDEYGDATSRNRSSAVRDLLTRGLADVERERAILLSVLADRRPTPIREGE